MTVRPAKHGVSHRQTAMGNPSSPLSARTKMGISLLGGKGAHTSQCLSSHNVTALHNIRDVAFHSVIAWLSALVSIMLIIRFLVFCLVSLGEPLAILRWTRFPV